MMTSFPLLHKTSFTLPTQARTPLPNPRHYSAYDPLFVVWGSLLRKSHQRRAACLRTCVHTYRFAPQPMPQPFSHPIFPLLVSRTLICTPAPLPSYQYSSDTPAYTAASKGAPVVQDLPTRCGLPNLVVYHHLKSLGYCFAPFSLHNPPLDQLA